MAFGSLQGIIGRAGGNEVIGRGVIDVGVSSYRIRHDMRTVSRAINTEAKLWGQAFRLAAVGIGAVAAAGTATVVGAVAVAEKFNTAMARVAAMTGVSTEEFKKLRQGILDMAPGMKQGPETLAKGMYFIASAGFRGAEGLKVLDQAAKAAAASGADLEVSADALVSVMNAYGLSADKAAYASNILTKTVMYGKVEYQDLAKAIGPVSTISRVAGIELEEMGASLAMLTTRGLSARRATNTLWSTLRALTKPTEQQWKMIGALGLDFAPEDVKTDGLIAVLRKFDKAARDWQEKNTGQKIKLTNVYDKDGKLNIEKSQKQFQKMNRGYFDMMSKMVGQSNAFLVSQILLQQGVTETFDFYYGKMKGFGDTTNEAFEKAKKLDFTIVFGQMASAVQVALIALGDKFLPKLAEVIQWLGVVGPQAINWFSKVLTETILPAAAAAGAAIGKLLAAVAGVFDFGRQGGKSPIETAASVIVSIFTYALGIVERFSDALSGLLTNSVIKQVAQFAAAWGAVALAFSLIRTASNGLASRLAGVAKVATFGRLGGSTSATAAATGATGITAAGGQLALSARTLNMAGTELIGAAYQLAVAARSMQGLLGIGQMRGPGGQFARMPGNVVVPSVGAAVPVASMGRFAATQARIISTQAAMAGKGLIGKTAAGLMGGLKIGLGGVGSLLSTGIGLFSKAFVPLLVVDIIGSIAKEPLGDILGNNPLTGTFFKEAGAAMKEDFWGGVMLAVETLLTGGKPDMYKGLAESTKIGDLSINTMAFKAIGVDAATVEKAQADALVDESGNPYPLVQQVSNYRGGVLATAQEARAKLEEQIRLMQKELTAHPELVTVQGKVSPWAQSIYDTAKALNIDVSGVANFLASGEIASFNTAGIWALAPRIAENFDRNIVEARDFILDFIATNVAQSGDTKFNKVDLKSLKESDLDTLVSLVTEDVDGQYTAFRAWYTNQLLAAAKGVPKTSADFGTLPTKAERQEAAVAANVKPLSEKITGLRDELDKIKQASPETFKLLTSFLDQYGEKIENAGGKAQKWLPIINEVFADELGGKKFTSKTFAGTDKKTGTKDDIIKYYFGGKEVSTDVLAEYWRKLDGMVTTAREGTGAELSLALAVEVGNLVQTGLADGMSIENIRKGIPDDLWNLFISSIPGGEQASEVLTTRMRTMWGSVAKDAKPSQKDKNKVVASFRSMFSTDDNTKINWDFVKKLLDDPAKLKKWISDQLATAIPAGVSEGIARGKSGTAGTQEPGGRFYEGGPESSDTSSTLGRDTWWADQLPDPKIPATLLNQYDESGKLVSVHVAKGLAYAAPLQESWWDTLTRSIGSFLPHSPVTAGPLKDPFLPNAGMAIVAEVGRGIIQGSGVLMASMARAISGAMGTPIRMLAFMSGYNIGNRIADGLKASIPNIAGAIGRIAIALMALLPHGSPAKKGPFAGKAWTAPYAAGANLTGQMTKGLVSKQLQLPGLQAGSHGKLGAAAGNTSSQSIYIDRMTLANAHDEEDIVQRLAFLMPNGR